MRFLLRSVLSRGGEILSGSTLPRSSEICWLSHDLKEAIQNRDYWRLTRVLDAIPNHKFCEINVFLDPPYSNCWREEDDYDFYIKTPLETTFYFGDIRASESVFAKMLKCKPHTEVVSEVRKLVSEYDNIIPATFVEAVLTKRELQQRNTLTQDL